jgi:hypothetical protein
MTQRGPIEVWIIAAVPADGAPRANLIQTGLEIPRIHRGILHKAGQSL